MAETHKCSTCGRVHEEVPLSFGADFPDMYANMKREDRDVRAVIGTDQCIIDQKLFFIRGCLEIPVIGSEEIFLWGLWALIREDVYDQISELWDTPGKEKLQGPFQGRIANSLAAYPETLNLKCEIIIQPLGARPLFRLEEPEHPLTVEQRIGITPGRALELVGLVLHHM